LKLNRNPFVETALAYALSYISSVGPSNISPSSITILADNDYYSTSSASLTGARFHDFGVPLSEANKTGLGSSAALVTAFTAAVLSYYLPKDVFDVTTEAGKRKLHNLAQAAHCAHGEPGTPKFGKQLVDIVNESGADGKWDTEIVKDQVKVPKGIRLVMCDVSCGSQTPGMVKQVLAWRKDTGAEAEKVWEGLQNVNEGLAQELVELAESGSKDYLGLRQRIQAIRQGIREMSRQSGVPIEPPAQTDLLDACSKVEGVVGGVVPGAGGYDAIALLIEDREEVVEKLRELLSSWKVSGETDGSMGKVSMLGVKQEMSGVRVEQGGEYAEWSE
jgi:phosphomevalonate kinase